MNLYVRFLQKNIDEKDFDSKTGTVNNFFMC